MMTPRERVQCALAHEEPDRVPLFFGTSGVTTMLAPAYERLRAHLGLPPAAPRLLSRAFQYARLDDDVLGRFASDGRPLTPRPFPAPLKREISEDEFVDEWGILWRRSATAPYYEVVEPPLRRLTHAEIERYPWPNLAHPQRFAGLAEEARRLHEETDYAVVYVSGVSLFEQICLLRGLDTWLMDMVTEPDFAHALLSTVNSLLLEGALAFLREAGRYVDVLVMGDDLGTQDSTLISPALYRRMLKPYHAETIAALKRATRASVFFHSDGNIWALLNDLVDVGVDIINPVQVSAGQMGDTARLKREFGARLSFCGAVDTQWVLPFGAPDDVRREVRRRIGDLAPGGGYICAPVHCIQPDVPPENVCALWDEALQAGRYPLGR